MRLLQIRHCVGIIYFIPAWLRYERNEAEVYIVPWKANNTHLWLMTCSAWQTIITCQLAALHIEASPKAETVAHCDSRTELCSSKRKRDVPKCIETQMYCVVWKKCIVEHDRDYSNVIHQLSAGPGWISCCRPWPSSSTLGTALSSKCILNNSLRWSIYVSPLYGCKP